MWFLPCLFLFTFYFLLPADIRLLDGGAPLLVASGRFSMHCVLRKNPLGWGTKPTPTALALGCPLGGQPISSLRLRPLAPAPWVPALAYPAYTALRGAGHLASGLIGCPPSGQPSAAGLLSYPSGSSNTRWHSIAHKPNPGSRAGAGAQYYLTAPAAQQRLTGAQEAQPGGRWSLP
jgi:hypothetical protein